MQVDILRADSIPSQIRTHQDAEAVLGHNRLVKHFAGIGLGLLVFVVRLVLRVNLEVFGLLLL